MKLKTYVSAAILILSVRAWTPAAEAGGHRFRVITAAGSAEGELTLDTAATPLVFYGRPGAAFSAQALADISKDSAVYTALLARGALLCAPEDLQAAAAWNGENLAEYRAMFSAADWPEFSGYAEPRLLVYSGETLSCELRGWRGGESLAELRSCLDKARLLTNAERISSAAGVIFMGDADDAWHDEYSELRLGETAALVRAGAFTAAAAAAYDDGALKKALLVSGYYNFRRPAKDSLLAQENVLAELKKRRLIFRDNIEDFHQRLLEAREFAWAEELRAANTGYGLAPVPPIAGNAAPGPGEAAVYFLEKGRDPLKTVSVRKPGDMIIITATPGCHWADMALIALEKHPEAGPLFRKHALLLSQRADFESIRNWNASHSLQYRLPAKEADWPGLDFDSSPSFYFFKAGKLVYETSGWSSEGDLSGMYAGLGKMFPGRKFRRKPPAAAPPAGKKEAAARPARRSGSLAGQLFGLNGGDIYKFCSSIRFTGGVFSGADMEILRRSFGDGRAERLKEFFGGHNAPAGPGGGKTIGELWSGLSPEEISRTCLSIRFHKGRFMGLNFGAIWEKFGSGGRLDNETMEYFSPRR